MQQVTVGLYGINKQMINALKLFKIKRSNFFMETSYIFNENEYLNIDNSIELDKSYIESFILSDHLTEEEENKREKLLNLIHEYSLDVSKVLNLCFL